MKVLVTGAAGFIGMHVAKSLLSRGDVVIGLDNLSDYYDVELKTARLKELGSEHSFSFRKIDITDAAELLRLFEIEGFEAVIHLAAQPGVRHSVSHPHIYAQSNVAGFLNVLEGCRHFPLKHLVYASTSSVYGGNRQLPFREGDCVDHPVSLYAATKKANELMAHTYSHLYGIPTSGLRFFTVYGPWGRPDMGIFRFTRAIMRGDPIQVYNHGRMSRDFTYVDDIVRGVVDVLDRPAQPAVDYDPALPDPATSDAPYRVLNIGNEEPVPLLEFISAIEEAVGRTAVMQMLPMQAGDVETTHADMSRLAALVPDSGARVPMREGVRRFVAWYRDFYGHQP